MLGDGLKQEHAAGRDGGMSLDDLEKFVRGARAAGANGDELVKMELTFRGKVKRASVQFIKIPNEFGAGFDPSKISIVPEQRSGLHDSDSPS